MKYTIKNHAKHGFTVEANDEATAHAILNKRLGYEPDDLGLIYNNEEKNCNCRLCEKRKACVHANCFRRLPDGLGECPKLK